MTGTSPWTPRSIYLYLVCLITLVMIIFGTVNVVRSLVDLLYPEPVSDIVPEVRPVGESGVAAPPVPSVEELAVQQALQRRWTMRHAALGIVSNGVLLLIAGPLYLYHWRRIQREARQQ